MCGCSGGINQRADKSPHKERHTSDTHKKEKKARERESPLFFSSVGEVFTQEWVQGEVGAEGYYTVS